MGIVNPLWRLLTRELAINLTFLTELAGFLAAKGLGAVAVDIFVESMPSSPENLLAVYLSGGQVSGSKTADILRFQVLVRDSSLTLAFPRAQAVWDLLQNSVGDFATKSRITPDGQLGTKFRDENQLTVFSLNFTAFIPR